MSRQQIKKVAWALFFVALVLFSFMWVMKLEPNYVEPVSSKNATSYIIEKNKLSDTAFKIIKEHCTNCHSANPTTNMFASAPAGVVLDNKQQILTLAPRIFQRTVVLKTMPFANITDMKEEERAILRRWYESLLKK